MVVPSALAMPPGPCPSSVPALLVVVRLCWVAHGYSGYPRYPGTQRRANGSQRTVNGPLTDPLTANGRMRPLTVNGVRELSGVARELGDAPLGVVTRRKGLDRRLQPHTRYRARG